MTALDLGEQTTIRKSLHPSEVQAILSEREGVKIAKPPELPDNVELLPGAKIEPSDYELINLLCQFTQNVTQLTRDQILDQLTQNPQDWGNERKRVLDQIKLRELDKPQFALVDRHHFKKLAEELGLDDTWPSPRPEAGDWVLIFRPAKPLDQFWHKGYATEASYQRPEDAPADTRKNDELGNIIKWGQIYSETSEQIWGAVDEFELKGLHLSRVNPRGDHKKFRYYYIWSAKIAENP